MTYYNIRMAGSVEAVKNDATFAQVCSYLRVDPGDDDMMVWQSFCAAYDYVMDAVGEVYESSAHTVILLMALTQEFYDNRELMQSDIQQRLRQRYSFQSIIQQLQMAKQIRDDAEEAET